MSLALVPPLHARESLPSFCSRTAALNGMPTAKAFGLLFRFSFEGLGRGWSKDVTRFAGLVCNPVDDLESRVVISGPGKLTVAGHQFSKDFACRSQSRVCPACIAEDTESGPGRAGTRAWSRLLWIPLFIRSCPIHECALVDHPARTMGIGPDLTHWLRASRLEELQRASVAIKPTPLEASLAARFENCSASTEHWIDNQPLQLTAHLSALVGYTESPGMKYSAGPTTQAWADAAAVGYDILRGGQNAFREVLHEQIAKNYHPRRKPTAREIFRNLITPLVRQENLPGYRDMINFVRETALAALPLSSTDEFLGSAVPRRFHTVRTISQEFSIPVNAVISAMGEHGVQPVQTCAGGPIMYHAEQAVAAITSLLAEETVSSAALREYRKRMKDAEQELSTVAYLAKDYLTPTQAFLKTGYPRDVIESLIDEGYLLAAGPPTKYGAFSIHVDEFSRFQNEYIAQTDLHQVSKRPAAFEAQLWERGIKPAIKAGLNFYRRDEVSAALD